MTSSIVIICSGLFDIFSWLSVSIFLGSFGATAPFDRPSTSFGSSFVLSLFLVHSLILPHYACYISACRCPRHNCRRRSLSMRVSSKKWPVPQLTGVYSIVRVLRNLDCTLEYKRKCFALLKNFQANDFDQLGECNQDFVAPAACHIPLSAVGLVTPFVAPAWRENAFWSCVLDWQIERNGEMNRQGSKEFQEILRIDG